MAWSAMWAGLGMEGTGCAQAAGAGGSGGSGWSSGQEGEGLVLYELIQKLMGLPLATLIERTLQKHS